MKKLFAILAILALVFGLSTCDTGENGENIDKKGTLSVHVGSLEIAHNSKGFTFSNTYIGESDEVTIVIKNTGSGNIKLTGSPYINLDGATAVFSVSSAPGNSTISPGSSVSFKIRFTPTNTAESYVYVSIPNNSENAPDFSFTVYGTGLRPKPTASVFYGDSEISQRGTIQVDEDIVITHSKEIQVVIKNTGKALLTIDTANITITGEDKDVFTLSTPPVSNVLAGEETFLRIECKPVKFGVNDATLTIPTNDESRNQVVVHLRATAVRGAAILKLSQGSTDIGNNSLTPFNFGRVPLDSNKPLVFTIKNTGNIDLELTGNPVFESSNPLFTVQTQPTNKTISPGADISFLLTYTPVDEKDDTGAITIYNDSDDMVFILNVKGTGYIKRPQITVRQGNTTVNQYGEYNFGTVALGESKDVTFDIENTGEANLNIVSVNGSRINLEDNTDALFSVMQQPSVVVMPGNSTNFIVRFSPTTEENNFTANVHIKTDSQDNKEFYFTVKGSGYLKRPQITVKQGNMTVNQYGEYNFDTVALGESKDVIFIIENTGEANLNITSVNGSRINFEGNSNGLFSVIQQPSAAVMPGNSTNFIVRFSPTAEGNNFTATVHIKTDSQDNDEFYFLVKGAGYIKRSQITVRQGTAAISPNGEYDFGSILFGITKDVIFTIGNTGEANLNFVSVNNNRINIENTTGNLFTIFQQPLAAAVTPGNTTTFTIRLNPTVIGNNYSAVIKIVTDSYDNDEFYFLVKGNGRNYVIGDTGPGGGIIFFAEGGQYKECSEGLGEYMWDDAVTVARNYRGGSFTNWHLPDNGELQLIYRNLLNNLGGSYHGWLWSSEEYIDSAFAYYMFFSDSGYRINTQRKYNSYWIRAVRSFSL